MLAEVKAEIKAHTAEMMAVATVLDYIGYCQLGPVSIA
jgi:hypothetical protein